MAGLLFDADFRTEAELISAGATKASLLNDTKIYLSTLGETLDDAITNKLLAGGTGIAINWRNDDTYACEEVTKFGNLAYSFSPNRDQAIYGILKVPDNYSTGKQIKLRIKLFVSTTSGSDTALLRTQTTLIRSTVDALSSTANQRTSTNTAVSAIVADKEYIVDLDLTDGTGYLGTPQIAKNDSIIIKIYRDTDTNTNEIFWMPSIYEVLI